MSARALGDLLVAAESPELEALLDAVREMSRHGGSWDARCALTRLQIASTMGLAHQTGASPRMTVVALHEAAPSDEEWRDLRPIYEANDLYAQFSLP